MCLFLTSVDQTVLPRNIRPSKYSFEIFFENSLELFECTHLISRVCKISRVPKKMTPLRLEGNLHPLKLDF